MRLSYRPKQKRGIKPLFCFGAVNKDKSEPHRRVMRFGFLLSPPDVWVPTLSAGAGNRGRTNSKVFDLGDGFNLRLSYRPIQKRGIKPLFCIVSNLKF